MVIITFFGITIIDNILGNEGIRRLYKLMLHNCFPSLKQLFLMNNKVTEDVTKVLIRINYQDTNPTNIVIPETQLIQLNDTEHKIMNTLYDKINSNMVKLLEISGIPNIEGIMNRRNIRYLPSVVLPNSDNSHCESRRAFGPERH